MLREGKELHNEELFNIYYSPNYIRIVKSKGLDDGTNSRPAR
jgi:hypothetical protein